MLGPAPGCPEAWSGCLPPFAAPAPRAIELAVGRALNQLCGDLGVCGGGG